eukprot:5680189-Alexandrium_andersonii.AAC.1
MSVVPLLSAVQMYQARKVPAGDETHSSAYCATRKHLSESGMPWNAMGRLALSILTSSSWI